MYSLYSDLPPPKFGDEDDGKPVVFITDSLKPLLTPSQTVISTNNINNNNKSHPQVSNSQVSNNLQQSLSQQKHITSQSKLPIQQPVSIQPSHQLIKPNNILDNLSQNSSVFIDCNDQTSTFIHPSDSSLEFYCENDSEEYDPAYPNSYDQYKNMLEVKRKLRDSKNIPKSNIDLNITGEEAWKRRATISDPVCVNSNSSDIGLASGNKKNLAIRLMEKMGWKAGEGLGRDKNGITVPLVAKKVTQNSAIITTQDPIFTRNSKIIISRILYVKSNDLLSLDILEEEASKYGNLLSIKAHDSSDYRIFLEFETDIQGANCYNNMNNSVINGKVILVYYYSVEEFNNNNLDHAPL